LEAPIECSTCCDTCTSDGFEFGSVQGRVLAGTFISMPAAEIHKA